MRVVPDSGRRRPFAVRRTAQFVGLALCLTWLWAGAALAAPVSPWSPLTSPAGSRVGRA